MSLKEINEQTSISFKIVVPLLTSIVLMTWIVSQKFKDVDVKLNSLDAKLSEFSEFWKVSDQQKWADEARKKNPTANVPYVSDILDARKK